MKSYYCSRDKKYLAESDMHKHKCLKKNRRKKTIKGKDGKPHFEWVGDICWRLIISEKALF